MVNALRARPIIEPADDLLTNGRLRPRRGAVPGWEARFHHCTIGVLRSWPTGALLGPTGLGHVELSQTVRAWPNQRYRLDVHAEPLAGHDGRRLAGSIRMRFASLRADEEIRWYEPPVVEVGGDAPIIHRAYFQCPGGTGRLRICLRFRACRAIVVQRVRLVECGDQLLTGHPLAAPPEPWRRPPPCLPTRVVLCDGRRDDRPLLAWLRKVFGPANVQRVAPCELRRWTAHLAHRNWLRNEPAWPPGGRGAGPQAPCQAGGRLRGNVEPAVVIDLPAGRAPRLPGLLAWSDRAIVIASLATFAGSAGRAGLRGIRLQDRISGLDMPCGKIVLPGHHVRGFALVDTIPYAWSGGRDSFAHRFLAIPKRTQARLDEMGIRPAIVTDCGRREIDNRPLALYRQGRSGALFAMDPDGLEAPGAGQDVPRIFDLIWRSALGRETVTLGQFSAPPTHYEGVLADLVELGRQYYDVLEDLSVRARVRGEGNWPPIWLLPGGHLPLLTHRGVLHIRTGFAEADWPAVYGLLLWLKQVAVAAMRGEPIGGMLLERMRLLAWPIAEPRNWRGCPSAVAAPPCDLAGGSLLGRIDLRVGRRRQTMILVPDRQREAIVRRGLCGWPRPGHPAPKVRIDPGAFRGEWFRRQGRTDRLICQVLLSGVPPAHPANSPVLTDLAATLLERLAFATFGLIVPNRSWQGQTVDPRTLAAAVQRVIQIDPDGHMEPVDVRRQRKIAVPPGGAIVGMSAGRTCGVAGRIRHVAAFA